MDISTFDQVVPRGGESLVIEEESLYRELEKVKDRRGKKGKRYPMAFATCEIAWDTCEPSNFTGRINGGILALIDFLGVKNVASKMRHFDEHYGEVLSLIFGTLAR